ncbi:MAG: hypothetical protein AAB408_04290 [Patescibacteria group bacterium]
MTYFSKLITIIALSLFIFSPAKAVGNLGDALGNLTNAGSVTGAESNAESILGTVINTALALVGTIFFILMVYAGYLWLTSRGDEGQVDKAKEIISASIIGLVIVVSAYAITVFVTSRFSDPICAPPQGTSCAVGCIYVTPAGLGTSGTCVPST